MGLYSTLNGQTDGASYRDVAVWRGLLLFCVLYFIRKVWDHFCSNNSSNKGGNNDNNDKTITTTTATSTTAAAKLSKVSDRKDNDGDKI